MLYVVMCSCIVQCCYMLLLHVQCTSYLELLHDVKCCAVLLHVEICAATRVSYMLLPRVITCRAMLLHVTLCC